MSDQRLKQITAVLFVFIMTLGLINMYRQFDALLVTFFVVLLGGVWWFAGREG